MKNSTTLSERLMYDTRRLLPQDRRERLVTLLWAGIADRRHPHGWLCASERGLWLLDAWPETAHPHDDYIGR